MASKFGGVPVESTSEKSGSKFGGIAVDGEPSKFANKPEPNPDRLDKYRADPNAPEMTPEQMQQMMEQLRSESDTGEIQRVRAESPKLAGAVDFLGGMGSMTRGALNLLPDDLGNTLMGDPKYMDKQSGSYLAGSLLDPAAYATGAEIASIPKLGFTAAAPLVEKMLKGGVIGGATGATVGGLTNDEDRTTGTAVGGTIGTIVGSLFPALGQITGRAVDMARGRMPDVRVGSMIREAAGDQGQFVRQQLANAGDDVSVAQAVGENVPGKLAALDPMTQTTDRGAQAFERLQRQEAARKLLLAQNTPDLAAAEAVRKMQAGGQYSQAFADDAARRQAEQAALNAARQSQAQLAQRNASLGLPPPAPANIPNQVIAPSLKKLTGNPVIQSAAREARLLAESGVEINGRPLSPELLASIRDNPMGSLEGLHLMKLAIDNQFKNGAETSLKKFSEGALNATKKKLVAGITDVSPGYDTARQTFSTLSAPVNQSQVMGEFSKVLQKEGGGEQTQQFLNLAKDGGTKLIKRANQDPRFGSLGEILTPDQMGAVNKVGSELSRDRAIQRAAANAKTEAADVVNKNLIVAQAPPVLNTTFTVMNNVLKRVGDKLNAKTLARLSEVMHDPKLAAQVIDTLPLSEKNIILRAMGNSKVVGRGVGMMTGAEQQ